MNHLHQVMVVDPVDRHEDEAEEIGEKAALLVPEVAEMIARRRLQLQHEDHDQDGHDAVGEGVQPLGTHVANYLRRRRACVVCGGGGRGGAGVGGGGGGGGWA